MVALYISTGRNLAFGAEGYTFDVPDADVVTQAAVVGSGAAVAASTGLPSQPLLQFMEAGTVLAQAQGHVVPDLPE